MVVRTQKQVGKKTCYRGLETDCHHVTKSRYVLVSDIVIFIVSYGYYSDTVARHTHYHTVYSLVTGDLMGEEVSNRRVTTLLTMVNSNRREIGSKKRRD